MTAQKCKVQQFLLGSHKSEEVFFLAFVRAFFLKKVSKSGSTTKALIAPRLWASAAKSQLRKIKLFMQHLMPEYALG